jgi:hypothetical protein
VPSTAPALVLAVPGSACAASEEIAAGVAAIAGASCPGVDVHVGYLDGDEKSLGSLLAAFGSNDEDSGERDARGAPSAVVVPLVASPHPEIDAVLTKAVADAGAAVILTTHLGPHPLLAEALHARLAEAGLARASRIHGMSIVSVANGILVVATRGDGAVQVAGVAAVLLAARLAVPAAPASLGDAVSIGSALVRLREARASSLAVAPCVIGPETSPGELAALAAQTGGECAEPLGAHPAVGQLVAMRYGTALDDRRLAQPGRWQANGIVPPDHGSPASALAVTAGMALLL